jgi:hypothetical protein
MPKRLSKTPRGDINELAARIVDAATSDAPPAQGQSPSPPQKNPHAVALGRAGGKKSAAARMAKLTPEQRREIAQKAAAARWRRTPD